MKYKYHYEIYRNGVLYDTAQDTLMLHIMQQHLLEMWGVERYNNFSYKKKRISKEEWKERYC